METASTPCSANRRSAILTRRLRVSLPWRLRNESDTRAQGIRSHGVQATGGKRDELLEIAPILPSPHLALVVPAIELAEHLDQRLRRQRPAHRENPGLDVRKRPGDLLEEHRLELRGDPSDQPGIGKGELG